MPELPDAAFRQWGVFSRVQALSAGWSDATLSRRVAEGHLIKLRRGMFALRPTDEDEHRLASTLLAQRGAAAALSIDASTLSHAAAAAVHGLALLDPPTTPCLTLPPPYLTQQVEIHLHRQILPADQLSGQYDFPVTSVARSCIDVTREQGLAAGLVTADDALHRRLISQSDLVAVYDRSCRGRAGLRDGRRLLELVDANSESPLESVSRLAMQGLPEPRTQVEIRTMDGRFLGRADFFWDEFGVVGEADGRSKYTDDELWKEKLRENGFTDHGLVVARWTWATARRPGALPAQLNGTFARARQLRLAGILPTVRVSRPEFP